MKTRCYWIGLCFCLVICFAGCKHKKSAASKQKSKKSVASAKPPVHHENKSGGSGTGAASHSQGQLSQKLGLSEEEIRNNQLFLFIEDWYGVPYKYGGCQKTGVDCSCFTNLLYEKVYHKKTGRSANEMYEACEKILLTEVKEGDLIFFKIGGNSVSHVGVYLRNKLFVHSSTSKGVIINSMDEAYYKKYFHSGGRLKNS